MDWCGSGNVAIVSGRCGEKGPELEGKSLNLPIYVLTLTYDHELWVVTERTRPWSQLAEMSFLHKVIGLTLWDKV